MRTTQIFGMETQRGTIKSDGAERKGKKGKRENEHREQKEKGEKKPGRESRDTHSEGGRGRENRQGESAQGNMFRDSLYGREKGESDSVLFLAYSRAVFDKGRWMDGWGSSGAVSSSEVGEHQSRRGVFYLPVFLRFCVCMCVCVCVCVCKGRE